MVLPAYLTLGVVSAERRFPELFLHIFKIAAPSMGLDVHKKKIVHSKRGTRIFSGILPEIMGSGLLGSPLGRLVGLITGSLVSPTPVNFEDYFDLLLPVISLLYLEETHVSGSILK